MAKKFVIITLGLIILYLVFQNKNIFAPLIKSISDIFGNSFRAVTSVGSFGQGGQGGK